MTGFRDEEELHDRIVEAPEALPLSGDPRIVATFREVGLGGGSADVIAFEASGRPVVIEVKLYRNPEARRAIVAQTLGYAAGLYGETVERLEKGILGRHLRDLGHSRLVDTFEDSAVDSEQFYENLAKHLAEGSFRIVFALDAARPVLVRLAGYLDAIGDRITVDLVRIAASEGSGEKQISAERVDLEDLPETSEGARSGQTGRSPTPRWEDGSDGFEAELDKETDSELVASTRDFIAWAYTLQQKGLCFVRERPRATGMRLYLVLPYEETVPIYVYPEPGVRNLWVEGSLGPRAPEALRRIVAITGKARGKVPMAEVTPELKDAIEAAYHEAAGV